MSSINGSTAADTTGSEIEGNGCGAGAGSSKLFFPKSDKHHHSDDANENNTDRMRHEHDEEASNAYTCIAAIASEAKGKRSDDGIDPLPGSKTQGQTDVSHKDMRGHESPPAKRKTSTDGNKKEASTPKSKPKKSTKSSKRKRDEQKPLLSRKKGKKSSKNADKKSASSKSSRKSSKKSSSTPEEEFKKYNIPQKRAQIMLKSLPPQDIKRFLSACSRRRQGDSDMLNTHTHLLEMRSELERIQRETDSAMEEYNKAVEVRDRHCEEDAEDLLLGPNNEWNERYLELKALHGRGDLSYCIEGYTLEEEKDTQSKIDNDNREELNQWMHRQRELKQCGELEHYKVVLFDRLDFDWDPKTSLVSSPSDSAAPAAMDEASHDLDETLPLATQNAYSSRAEAPTAFASSNNPNALMGVDNLVLNEAVAGTPLTRAENPEADSANINYNANVNNEQSTQFQQSQQQNRTDQQWQDNLVQQLGLGVNNIPALFSMPIEQQLLQGALLRQQYQLTPQLFSSHQSPSNYGLASLPLFGQASQIDSFQLQAMEAYNEVVASLIAPQSSSRNNGIPSDFLEALSNQFLNSNLSSLDVTGLLQQQLLNSHLSPLNYDPSSVGQTSQVNSLQQLATEAYDELMASMITQQASSRGNGIPSGPFEAVRDQTLNSNQTSCDVPAPPGGDAGC